MIPIRPLQVAEDVMKFIQTEGHEASRKLAKKRGAFPNFKQSVYDKKGEPPLRNATITTIAPTGTISIIANASSGVEPIFAVSYIRQVMDDDILVEVNPLFEAIAKARGFYSLDLMQKIAEHGTVRDMDEVPPDIQALFATAHDISPEVHIGMQAAFQKFTDNAVSKTVNFTHGATLDDVAKAYRLAYQLDCKGVTIYRDGSRDKTGAIDGQKGRKSSSGRFGRGTQSGKTRSAKGPEGMDLPDADRVRSPVCDGQPGQHRSLRAVYNHG